MNNNVIYSINGPVVKVKDTVSFSMLEMVYVGNDSLMGEVISISKEFTTIQVYETTTGLKPGEPVVSTGSPICATLGPGILRNIFDGIERPLKALEKAVQGRYVVIKDELNRRVHLTKRGKCYDTQYHKQTNGNHPCNP